MYQLLLAFNLHIYFREREKNEMTELGFPFSTFLVLLTAQSGNLRRNYSCDGMRYLISGIQNDRLSIQIGKFSPDSEGHRSERKRDE